MKIRFEVNQAEAFRLGVDCPKSIVSIEVDPASLDQTSRDQIAKRLDGIDVCAYSGSLPRVLRDGRVRAKLPTLEELLIAIEEDEKAYKSDIGSIAKAGPSAR